MNKDFYKRHILGGAISSDVSFKVTREQCEAINAIANLTNVELKTFRGYPLPPKAIKPSVNIKQVIVQPDKKVIVVIFANGDKSIVKCGKDDTFSIENGVAIAISKYVLGSGAEFKRLVKNAKIQEVKKEVKTIANNALGEVPTKMNAVESDKIEVGDTVEVLTNTPWFNKGDVGKVDSVDETDNSACVKANNRIGYWIYMYDLKLIKKGEKR